MSVTIPSSIHKSHHNENSNNDNNVMQLIYIMVIIICMVYMGRVTITTDTVKEYNNRV